MKFTTFQKVSWTTEILAEHKGLGGISQCDVSGSGKHLYSLYLYEAENKLYSGFYDIEGNLFHEHHKITDISYTTLQEDCRFDRTYFLYLSDFDIPQVIGTDPLLLRCYDKDFQIYLKNLETGKEFLMPAWGRRVAVDYEWRNPGTNYVQLWDQEEQSQIQTLDGEIAILLGKYDNVSLADIAPKSLGGSNKEWFTFRYTCEGKSKAGLWKAGKVILDNIYWIRSSEIEGVFCLSADNEDCEDHLRGECLYHVDSGWKSKFYPSLYQAYGNFFIGESKKNLDLFTQENTVQILRYEEKQLWDISPKEFDLWIAMDFSTKSRPNQFLFVKKGEIEGQIYSYEGGKWNFIQSTGLRFEENSYHKIRADWDELEEAYMMIYEKIDTSPSFGYYFLDTNYFLEMQECYPVLPKSKANFIGQIEHGHQRFTLFNRKGEILFQVSGLSKSFERGNKVFYVKNDESMRYYYINLATGTHKMIQGELEWVYNPDIRVEVELFRCKNGRDILFLLDKECFIELPEEIEAENILYASMKEQMLVLQTKSDQEGIIRLLKLSWESRGVNS